MIIMHQNVEVISKKNTKAEFFKDLEIGDCLQFSVSIEHSEVGGHCGTRAVFVKVENLKTGKVVEKSFNQLSNILKKFEFKEIEDELKNSKNCNKHHIFIKNCIKKMCDENKKIYSFPVSDNLKSIGTGEDGWGNMSIAITNEVATEFVTQETLTGHLLLFNKKEFDEIKNKLEMEC